MTRKVIRWPLAATGPLNKVAVILVAALALSLSSIPGGAAPRPLDSGLFALSLKQVALELKAPSARADFEPKWAGPTAAGSSPVAVLAGMQASVRVTGTSEIGRYPPRPASQGPPGLA